jgi:hypothetical protein
MKRFCVVLALGLFFPFFCFAQTQTGNASYNPSKTGFVISHSSLSFNTRVRVTNLRNSRSVEAAVTGRIPISNERIADISRDAGDALEMARTGVTQVRIEVLSFHPAAAEPAPAAGNSAPNPVSQAPAQPQPQQNAPAPAPAPEPPEPAVRERTVIEPQYIPVPSACPGSCSGTPLMLVVVCLLLIVIILLTIILILLVRRPFLAPLWPYPLWFRRRFLYAKKHRRP